MLSNKPWQPESVLLFCGAQFLCFGFGILAAALLHKAGASGFTQPDDFGNILVATLSFQGATWVLIPFFLRWNEIHWRDFFGLRMASAPRALAWAALGFLVVLPVALVLELLSQAVLQEIGWAPQAQAAVEMLMNAPLWPTGVYLGVFAVVLAPIAEEFIFRGVLFRSFKHFPWPAVVRLFREAGMPTFARFIPGRRFWRIFAWFGVSGLFALIHGDVAIFVPLFALALALTWLYEKTGSLLAPIAVHGLFNAANLVLLLLAKEFSLQLPVQP
jgi:membrane protease YdiL (CAAX protease family)